MSSTSTNIPAAHKRKFGALQKLSLTIIGSLETFFYNWGHNIAKHPWKFILGCLILTVTCGLGLIWFTPENRPDKLWIPWNSEFARDSDWLRANFPSPVRFHYAIVSADNVLQPRVLKMLSEIHQNISSLNVKGRRWSDICFKLPVTKFLNSKRRRRQVGDGNDLTWDGLFSEEETDLNETILTKFDPSIELAPEIYCEILNNLDEVCWESSIIELWNFNSSIIDNLTETEILETVNRLTISPVFGRSVNYTTEMSGIVRNSTGEIVKASALLLRWFAKINQTALHEGKGMNDLGTGELVDEINLLMEKELISVFQNFLVPQGVKMHFSVGRSFGDISGATIMNDAGMFAVGFSIVFIYVIFMLGKFNMVEQRPFLSLAGLSCIGLAIVVSYGICSAFGLIYGPVHNVLPFLLLGIGIDDMFVIVQCWNNLLPTEMKKPLPDRMGLTLKHAGVSITVTSITDFVAFAIGGTTVLPALQSFCIYAAIGVVATYIFQATFFVAWFSLDQRRIENNRNAFFLCYKYEEFTPNECSLKNYAKLFFERVYSNILFRKSSKVIVFCVTGVLLGVSIWGNFNLRQEFNPIWFLPQDSYLFQYFQARDKYFPGRGDEAFILLENVATASSLPEIENLVKKVEMSKSVYDVDSWYTDFKEYANNHFKAGIPTKSMSDKIFRKYLGKFLFSPSGAKYRSKFKFIGNLTCGERAPPIVLSSLGFKFKTFNGPEEHIPAMHEVKNFVRETNFSTENAKAFVWSFAFAGWETDEIITVEMYRNMALAMLCVFITTLLLIANLLTCLMVLTCVLFTLVDVGGGMYFWNLTIDTVSCIDLVIAIGLCVDYAAHIGHSFMTCVGSRDERAKKTLRDIGPAVLNGGLSTFLAFVLLANSRSHVFITFFKVFFLVVLFGLFHGLVFLPVLLSVIGSDPYPSAIEAHYNVEAAMELNPAKKLVKVPSKIIMKSAEDSEDDDGN